MLILSRARARDIIKFQRMATYLYCGQARVATVQILDTEDQLRAHWLKRHGIPRTDKISVYSVPDNSTEPAPRLRRGTLQGKGPRPQLSQIFQRFLISFSNRGTLHFHYLNQWVYFLKSKTSQNKNPKLHESPGLVMIL